MITILGILALVYIIIANKSLSNRLDQLELKIKNGAGEARPVSADAPQSAPILKEATPHAESEQAKLEPNHFVTWLKEDWLMKLGAALFIIGFGWFISYAIANGWIGEIGRIALGIIAGIIIMALGFKRMMRFPGQGALFMALGAGMAMLTIFAGRSLYGFFDPMSAVFFDFVIVAFVSFASYKFNVKSLAFIAQILAFVTPLLVAGQTNSIFLFSYLFFISLATLLLAGITGWRDLIVSSLIFVGFYSLPYLSAGGNFYNSRSIYGMDAPVVLYFAYLFSMLYLLTGMFAVVKKGIENVQNEISLAVLNGLFLFLWIYNVAPKEWSALIFAIFAFIFAVSSFIAFQFSAKLAPFYAYGSVAVAFIGAATSAQLNGVSLTIAFTMEILLLISVVFSLTKSVRATVTTAWLFIVPVILSFSSLSDYASARELFTKDFFALALLAFAFIFAGRIVTASAKQAEEMRENNAGSVMVIFGTFYIGYILWQFIHILISSDPDMATMVTLIIYTIFGLIAYFAGLYGNDMARRTYGIALLAFVVVRLVLVDVWHMELFGRVVTFLAIGILLMSTAFITKRKKQELTHA